MKNVLIYTGMYAFRVYVLEFFAKPLVSSGVRLFFKIHLYILLNDCVFFSQSEILMRFYRFEMFKFANICHFYSNESVIIEKLAGSFLFECIHCMYHLCHTRTSVDFFRCCCFLLLWIGVTRF